MQLWGAALPLVVVESVNAMPAVMIDQKYMALTRGPRVGTANMAFCMGLVMHSPSGRLGCLAHIEARDISGPAYIEAFRHFAVRMTTQIFECTNAKDPGLQVGLFGNLNGPAQRSFTNDVADALAGCGVRPTEVIDQRNTLNGNNFVNGGNGRKDMSRIGGIIYDPTAGTVHCYEGRTTFTPINPSGVAGVTVTQLQ